MNKRKFAQERATVEVKLRASERERGEAGPNVKSDNRSVPDARVKVAPKERPRVAEDPAAERRDLIGRAAEKPVRTFWQIDGWADTPPVPGVRDCRTPTPDPDGDVVMGSEVRELRNTTFPVRVQIHEGANRGDVLRLLQKAVEWLDGPKEQAIHPNARETARAALSVLEDAKRQVGLLDPAARRAVEAEREDDDLPF